MLARQLRLRLVAEEDSDIPRNCSNIIVSIHAIATFQALNDYLRPRISGLHPGMMSGSGSRLSGMLAALAASGLTPGSLGRNPPATGVGSSSQSAPPPVVAPPSGEQSAVGRRRSTRLSARSAGPPDQLEMPHQAGSETAVNDEDLQDGFPDDDYDAEVCLQLLV